MFDNWYVVQVRTGKEEEIVKKCQFYIDHDILIDCFIPITKKKKKCGKSVCPLIRKTFRKGRWSSPVS